MRHPYLLDATTDPNKYPSSLMVYLANIENVKILAQYA